MAEMKTNRRNAHARSIRMAAIACVAMSAALGASHARAALDAEYAVRWDPDVSGPQSAEAAAAALGMKKPKERTYEVRYFRLDGKSVHAPPAYAPILRERRSGDKAELTFKLRGPEPLPGKPKLKKWDCPLGKSKDRKDEADVTLLSGGEPKKAYSRSCTRPVAEAPAPASMGAQPTGCTATLRRLEDRKITVEEWHFANRKIIEVSRKGKDNANDLREFERKIALPLIDAGARPTAHGMTEAVSACKATP